MLDKDWKGIHYMHYSVENWGDPEKIDFSLVQKIEQGRILCNKPISLTCPAYSLVGHTTNSWHSKGKAADIRIHHASLLEMFLWAESLGFTGIGLYPNNGRPFIHVDLRPLLPIEKAARWIGLPWSTAEIDHMAKKGMSFDSWKYIDLSVDNFKNYII